MATVPSPSQYLGGTHRAAFANGFAAVFIAAAAFHPTQPFIRKPVIFAGPQASTEQRLPSIRAPFPQGGAAATGARPVASQYHGGAHRGAYRHESSIIKAISFPLTTASNLMPAGDFNGIAPQIPINPQPVLFSFAPPSASRTPLLVTIVAAPQVYPEPRAPTLWKVPPPTAGQAPKLSAFYASGQYPEQRRSFVTSPFPMETPPGMPAGDFTLIRPHSPEQPQPVIFKAIPPSVAPETPLLRQSYASGQSPEQAQPYLTNSAWRPIVDIAARASITQAAPQLLREKRTAFVNTPFFDPIRQSPIATQFVALPIGDQAAIKQFSAYGQTFGDPSLLPIGRATALYVHPRFNIAVSGNKSTGAYLYIPVRNWVHVTTVGVTHIVDRTDLKTWLPPLTTPIANKDGTMNVQWWKFFKYVADTKLGGPEAPTIGDITTTVEVAQAQASEAANTATSLQQAVANNAEALAVTRDVIQDNAIPGSTQIPPIKRYLLDE